MGAGNLPGQTIEYLAGVTTPLPCDPEGLVRLPFPVDLTPVVDPTYKLTDSGWEKLLIPPVEELKFGDKVIEVGTAVTFGRSATSDKSFKEQIGLPDFVSFVPGPADVVNCKVAPTETVGTVSFNRFDTSKAQVVTALTNIVEEMMSQGVNVVGATSASSMRTTGRNNAAVGVISQTFKDIGERLQLVASRTWTSDQGLGVPIFTLDTPFEGLRSSTIAAPLQRFVYSNFTVRFVFTVNSNSFQAGKLIAYFVPLSTPEQALTTHGGNYVSQMCTQHLLMPAGKVGTYQMDIPWRYPLDALDLRRRAVEPAFGTLVIEPLSILTNGADSINPTVTYTVSMALLDGEYKIPDPTVAPDIPTVSLRIREEGNYMTKSYNISGVANSSIDFPGGDGQSASADVSVPFDNVNVAVNPPAAVRRAYNYVSNTGNVNFGEDLQPQMGIANPPRNLAFHDDELVYRGLLLRPTFLTRFTVSTLDEINAIKFSERVTPTSDLYGAEFGSTIQPTLLSYLSLPFTYWSGDLVYTFMFVGSPLHNVRLGFTTHYNRDFDIPDENEAYGQYADIVTFDGDYSEHRVVVPYLTNMAKKRVLKGFVSDLDNYSLGRLSARVYNKLQAPETVANTVEFIVLVHMENGHLENVGVGPVDYRPVDEFF